MKNSANITLTVEDDGNGFDINKFDKLKGFGLTNIQSRVDYLKGNLTVDSELNKGTSVFIEIPN
ncbi:MAG: hypothetical protein IPL21_18300 [Saprospirales bacterium]|nr:hypothetical protein [Saprospirales bacterium]